MKKRWLAVALILGLAGGSTAGFAAGIFIYPFWFLTDVASEKLDAEVKRTNLATGAFLDVSPSDPVHWGMGKVTLHDEGGRRLVYLHEDFEVGPGPRFHVYLVDNPDVRSKGDFENANKLDLGRLRAFKGSQIYGVPGGIDTARYGSVVIWCKEFGVLISSASLAAKVAATPGASTAL